MRTGHRIALALLTAAGLGAAGPVTAQEVPADMPERAQLSGEEDHPTIVLPEPSPHWVYVVDPVFPHLIASKVYALDGDTLNFLGMFNTGYVPTMALAHDNSAIYVTETYWSRGSRGDRSDMVTVYDPKTLAPTNEIELPQGRFLVVPKKQNTVLTTDGRYLLSYNMDPATSVSVVDVQEGRYVGELETPGCALLFPTGPTSFSMLCADGSFANISFDPAGEAQVENGEPFFNTEEDPVFEHAALHRPSGQGFLVSYDGWVYPVDFSGGTPEVGERFQLQGQGDEGWRPGGWQVAAYHAATNRLFVLMHQGGRWTHKQAGEEVWVIDLETRQRVERFTLPHHSISLHVSQDDQPLLFALSEAASVSVFDATSYEHKGDKEGIGDSPFLLYGFGE